MQYIAIISAPRCAMYMAVPSVRVTFYSSLSKQPD